MPELPYTFRDFGILPEGLPPPPEHIRCFLSRSRIIGQYIAVGFLFALGLGLAVPLALFTPFPLNLLGAAAAVAGFGSFVFLVTHNDYRWIELDGNTLRAKHLYTGRVIERSLEEVDTLATIVYQIRRLETIVIESLLGRVKGIEIRFRDRRTPLRVLRSDPAMTNAQEFIQALVFRMTQVREVDAEVVNLDGKPLVRYIHWKGEKPTVQSGKSLKVTLACLVFMLLTFGPVLGFSGLQEQRRHELGSVPPHEIPLATLIENGPGSNLHVVLTDFGYGGYVVETKSGYWQRVWVALFPRSNRIPGDQEEIKVVLSCSSVADEVGLKKLLQRGRITGICSDAPSSNFGATVGPKLVGANPGSRLSSAWQVDELREPPSAALVQGLFWGSAGCYVSILGLVLVIFLKS